MAGKKTESNYAFTWLTMKVNRESDEYKKFLEGLEKLNGYDLEAAERAEITAGNNAPILTLTKAFQARLAAKALGVPAPEVRALPMRAYNTLTNEVLSFLYRESDELESARRIEESQSDVVNMVDATIG